MTITGHNSTMKVSFCKTKVLFRKGSVLAEGDVGVGVACRVTRYRLLLAIDFTCFSWSSVISAATPTLQCLSIYGTNKIIIT